MREHGGQRRLAVAPHQQVEIGDVARFPLGQPRRQGFRRRDRRPRRRSVAAFEEQRVRAGGVPQREVGIGRDRPVERPRDRRRGYMVSFAAQPASSPASRAAVEVVDSGRS